MECEAELYIPVLNERGEKVGETFSVVPFTAVCPTEAMYKALDAARVAKAEFVTFGRKIDRDSDGMPDYGKRSK